MKLWLPVLQAWTFACSKKLSGVEEKGEHAAEHLSWFVKTLRRQAHTREHAGTKGGNDWPQRFVIESLPFSSKKPGAVLSLLILQVTAEGVMVAQCVPTFLCSVFTVSCTSDRFRPIHA